MPTLKCNTNSLAPHKDHFAWTSNDYKIQHGTFCWCARLQSRNVLISRDGHIPPPPLCARLLLYSKMTPPIWSAMLRCHLYSCSTVVGPLRNLCMAASQDALPISKFTLCLRLPTIWTWTSFFDTLQHFFVLLLCGVATETKISSAHRMPFNRTFTIMRNWRQRPSLESYELWDIQA